MDRVLEGDAVEGIFFSCSGSWLILDTWLSPSLSLSLFHLLNVAHYLLADLLEQSEIS